MSKLKQKTTWLGLASIVTSVAAFSTGALTPEVATAAIMNGLGLVVADA